MSARAAAYQEQITGQAIGSVYRVNGVKFDGFADGVLQDAKGPPPGRVTSVAETFYIGAYWGPREEPVFDCAHRLSSMLNALGAVDPLLASWFHTGASRKAALARSVDPSPEVLQELLLKGVARRDDAGRSVMTELGFSASIWNGQKIQVGVNVRCGSSAAVPGLASNSVVVQLPEAQGEAMALYRRDTALALLRAVIMAWRPSWSTWTSHRLRKAQDAQPGEVVVGWATYVADPSGVRADRLPASVTTEPLDVGMLVTADGDADVVSETTVSAVRGALGRTLRASL